MLMNLTLGLSFFSIAPVTPLIMDEYGINRSTASLLTGLVILVQTLFAIPGGALVGRIGLKKLIGIAWLLSAMPALTFLADSFVALLVLRVLYALSFALIIPAFGVLLMQWFKPAELPLINGLNMAVGTAGVSLSVFTAVPLANLVGWQGAVSLFGATALVGSLAWLILGKTSELSVVKQNYLPLREVVGVLRSKQTILLAIADAGPFSLFVALTAWLPTFYFEVHEMSLERSGLLVGLLPFIGIFSVLAAGILALKITKRRPFLMIPGLLVGIGGFGAFLLVDTFALYPALLLLGFGAWFYIPILLTIPLEDPDADPQRVPFVMAAIMSFGGILAFLSPLTVGMLADVTGTYTTGFSIFAFLSWSLLAAGYLMPETGGRQHTGLTDSVYEKSKIDVT